MLRRGTIVFDVGATAIIDSSTHRLRNNSINLRRKYNAFQSIYPNNEPLLTHPILLPSIYRPPIFQDHLDSKIITTTTPVNSKLKRQLIPNPLQKSLNRFSDSHARLLKVLDYSLPERLSLDYIDEFLKVTFKTSTAEETFKYLSKDLLIKLARFHVRQGSFAKVADIYWYFYEEQQLFNISVLSKSLFELLQQRNDLKLGFIDLMKFIYAKTGEDIGTFTLFFKHITHFEGADDLNVSEFTFLNTLKVLQLSSVIESIDDVLKLPKQYWFTDFEYINMLLITKLLVKDHTHEAFKHFERTSLVNVDGCFHRLLGSFPSTSGKILTFDAALSFSETRLLEIMKKKKTKLSERDIRCLSLFSNSHKFHLQSFLSVEDSQSIKLKNAYLAKLLKKHQLNYGLALLNGNLDIAEQLEVSTLVTFLLATNNLVQLKRILRKLSEDKKSLLVNQTLSRITSENNLELSSDKFKSIDLILSGVSYKLDRSMMKKLALVAKELTMEQLTLLSTKITGDGVNHWTYFLYNLPNNRALALSRSLLNNSSNHSLTKKIPLFLVKNCSPQEISHLLLSINMHTEYEKIHSSIIFKLVQSGKVMDARKILNASPCNLSRSIILDHELVADPLSLNYVGDLEEIDKLRLQTMKRLIEMENVSFNREFKTTLSAIFSSKRGDHKLFCEVLIKHISKQIRRRTKTGELIMTGRLKWACGLCLNSGISQEEVSEFLNAN